MSEAVENIDAGSDIAHTPPGGLLAGIKKEVTAPSTAPVDLPSQHEDQWFWDEGAPGAGPRPSWLESKFKSVAEKARSHTELEKLLGQRDAPENYSFGEYEGQIDAANPHMLQFMETAKKSRMSQEAFGEMIDTLIQYEAAKIPNRDAEIAKLGPNANTTIENVRRWASTHLSEAACNLLGEIGNRADVIQFMDEVRQLSIHQASQPPGANAPAENFVVLTKEDIDAELAVPANGQRYINDPKYRAEISRKYAMVLGDE